MSELEIWLSFADLQATGVVKNWQTLKDWQKNYNFPPGRLFGKNSPRRSKQRDIDPWLQTRPVEDAELIQIMRERAARSVESPRHISKQRKNKPPSG